MAGSEPVTEWIKGLEGGGAEAANRLVERYFDELVRVAQREYGGKFGGVSRPAEDEEDAALSAVQSFFEAARDGRIQNVANRRQLWALLVKITIRKVYDQRERANAMKRGGKQARASASALEKVESKAPDPQDIAELADTYRAAMDALTDAELKRIAELDSPGKEPPGDRRSPRHHRTNRISQAGLDPPQVGRDGPPMGRTVMKDESPSVRRDRLCTEFGKALKKKTVSGRELKITLPKRQPRSGQIYLPNS
jgi:hypothetical protein